MTLRISGRIPSKKNSKRIVMFGHRPAIISSKDYEAWHTIASYEIKPQIHGLKLPLCGPQKIELVFYAETKRLWDLTNKAESIMDLLTDSGVIQDDNYSFVPMIHLLFGGWDKKNPRAEITITPALA